MIPTIVDTVIEAATAYGRISPIASPATCRLTFRGGRSAPTGELQCLGVISPAQAQGQPFIEPLGDLPLPREIGVAHSHQAIEQLLVFQFGHHCGAILQPQHDPAIELAEDGAPDRAGFAAVMAEEPVAELVKAFDLQLVAPD